MDNRGNIVIYQTKDGKTSIDVKLEDETVWLTQAQMAELFQTDRTSIVKHVNNIYKSEELVKDSTCAKIAHVQIEDISHCFSCSDAASLTLIEAIFFCLSLILRCLLLPAYHNTPASEHKPEPGRVLIFCNFFSSFSRLICRAAVVSVSLQSP